MTLQVRGTAIDGVVEIRPPRFDDERGSFAETWNARDFADAGLAVSFLQDNESYSAERGVLRGLHLQVEPLAQDKLVRVASGAIFDVAVDLRQTSRTFGRWVGVEISAAKGNQLFVPRGFAHGFVALVPRTLVIYKVSAFYSRAHERSIRFDDPQLAIAWPVPPGDIRLSDKDRNAPLLAEANLVGAQGEAA